jgi:muconolactone delta-isomerase
VDDQVEFGALGTDGSRRARALPGQGRSLGVYRAKDSAEMEAIVKSLPLDPWMAMEIMPLTPHPSDPATTSA